MPSPDSGILQLALKWSGNLNVGLLLSRLVDVYVALILDSLELYCIVYVHI